MHAIDINILVFDGGRVLALRGKDVPAYRLPGTMLRRGETLAEAAARGLKAQTGLEVVDARFVGIYDAPDRDPSGRVIAAVLLATIWRGDIAPEGRASWVQDFLAAPFVLDHSAILHEQKDFRRLSIKLPAVTEKVPC